MCECFHREIQSDSRKHEVKNCECQNCDSGYSSHLLPPLSRTPVLMKRPIRCCRFSFRASATVPPRNQRSASVGRRLQSVQCTLRVSIKKRTYTPVVTTIFGLGTPEVSQVPANLTLLLIHIDPTSNSLPGCN